MLDDRRNPLRPFQASLIRGFLRKREILSVELFPSGKSNSNYKLILSDGKPYVLRLYSNGDSKRECHVMDLVRDFVPVPQEIARGDTWSVFTFLEGSPLAKVPEHSGAAAEALARISSVTFPSPGWINPDGSIEPVSFGGVKGFIAEYAERSDVQHWIGEDTAEAIHRLLISEAPRFAELDGQPYLVHGDFNLTNVLIKGGVVSGILDWEYSHAGTPYMDIGNLLRNIYPQCHGQIQSGLEAGGMIVPKDWKELAELVDLTSHLEFLTSLRSDRFKRECVARIKNCLTKFRVKGEYSNSQER